ncbi:MAG: type II toxin-antitoxin system RelE/ParE family toxin [Solimonas sp.]
MRDVAGRAIIARRLSRIENGNFGDTKPVGDGVRELRIDFGLGYRVYYAMRGKVVVFLLFGGDKGSQARGIVKANALASQIGGP